ncbi:MAG TPA: response regulator [Cyclobacteriaceae bacterium]|nr:response regulator [Cyclobacteriaceae bacterium]
MSESSILVVDDDKEDQLILQEYFAESGITGKVIYLDNGEVTINHLEGIPEDDELPRLIVLDLNMPVLNGTQTLLYLKREPRFKKIPVIIFSTSENEDDRRKCLSYGAVDYLVKPMSYEEGQAIVKRFASYLD